MSKPKLTQNQKRRIQSNNNKVLHRHQKKEIEWRAAVARGRRRGNLVIVARGDPFTAREAEADALEGLDDNDLDTQQGRALGRPVMGGS